MNDPSDHSPGDTPLAGLVRGSTLAQKAAAAITTAIDNGQLQPGQRLVEAQLAQSFGTSRGPLREAMTMLEAQGLIVRRGAAGSFVSDPSEDFVAQAVIVRGVIEGLGARFAATSDPETVLPVLEKAYRSMEKAAEGGDRNAFFDAHRDFHAALCDTTGKSLLGSFGKIARAQIEVHVRRSGVSDIDFDLVLSHHRFFIKLIKSGDPAKAEAAIRNMIIESSFKTMKRSIPDAIKDFWTS